MRRLVFIIGLNFSVLVFATIALSNQWQALGAILCLSSYPTIFLLGWVWSKNRVKIRFEVENNPSQQQIMKTPTASRESRF